MTAHDLATWLPIAGLVGTWLAGYVAWRVTGATMQQDVRTLMQGEPGNAARRAARVEDVDKFGEKVNENRADIDVMRAELRALVDNQHQNSAAIIAHIEAGRREAAERDARLSVALAEMKGKTDVCASLEKVGERIVDAIKTKGDR